MRSVAQRYAAAVFAFMAAATWLGVSVVNGLLCLLVAVIASQAMRAYQRRSDTDAAASKPSRQRKRAPRANERPRASELYDAKADDFEWPSVGASAW